MEKITTQYEFQHTSQSLIQLKDQILHPEDPINQMMSQIKSLNQHIKASDPMFLSVAHNELSKYQQFKDFCAKPLPIAHKVSPREMLYAQILCYFLEHWYWYEVSDGIVSFISVEKQRLSIKPLKFIPELFPEYQWPQDVEVYVFNDPQHQRKWMSVLGVIFINEGVYNDEILFDKSLTRTQRQNIILANEVAWEMLDQKTISSGLQLLNTEISQVEFVSDYASMAQEYTHLKHLLTQALCFNLSTEYAKLIKQYRYTNIYIYEQVLYPIIEKSGKLSELQRDVAKAFESWDATDLIPKSHAIIEQYFPLFKAKQSEIISQMKQQSLDIIKQLTK